MFSVEVLQAAAEEQPPPYAGGEGVWAPGTNETCRGEVPKETCWRTALLREIATVEFHRSHRRPANLRSRGD